MSRRELRLKSLSKLTAGNPVQLEVRVRYSAAFILEFNEGRMSQVGAAHPRQGAADRGEYRQAAGAGESHKTRGVR